MSEFTDNYRLLLQKQYYNKENATAEVEALMSAWEEIFNFQSVFASAFDIDNATGDRQDKLGKILGIPRNIPFIIPKTRFGFEGDPTSTTFGSIFDSLVDSRAAPFFSIFENPYSDIQLDDVTYKPLLKAKVENNNGSSYMVSDELITVQDVVQTIFSGEAYIVDNYDMTMTMYVDTDFDDDIVTIVETLNLIPVGQGVTLNVVRTNL